MLVHATGKASAYIVKFFPRRREKFPAADPSSVRGLGDQGFDGDAAIA